MNKLIIIASKLLLIVIPLRFLSWALNGPCPDCSGWPLRAQPGPANGGPSGPPTASKKQPLGLSPTASKTSRWGQPQRP